MHFGEKILAKKIMSTFLLQKYTTEIFKEHEKVTKNLTLTVSPLNAIETIKLC